MYSLPLWIGFSQILSCLISFSAQQEAALKTGHVPSLHRMHASKIPPHKAIFFNEPKLSDLKQVMMKAGFQAEFNKGVLVVDDKIAVRKVLLYGLFNELNIEILIRYNTSCAR